MNKYIIYSTEGGTYGEQLRPNDKEEDVKKWITDNGGTVLRPNSLVGKDEADAISRYNKASGLRKEASDIQSAGKRQMTANEANARMNAEIQGGIYGDEPSLGGYAVQLLKAPQTALAAGFESLPSLLSPSQLPEELASNFKSIYENPSEIESIATDPTLLIPGTKEVKAIKNAPKVVKALRYAIKPAIDAGAQTGASILVDDLSGNDVGASDVAGRYGAGLVGGTLAKGAGEAVTAGGKKILQSVIKPKTGSDIEGKIVEGLMEAKKPNIKPEESFKLTKSDKVIGANSSLDKMYKDLEDAIEGYSELQAGSLDTKSTIKMLPAIKRKMDTFREMLDIYVDARKINEDAYKKYSDILDMEERRLLGTSDRVIGTPTPLSAYNLHTAKMDFGKKSRYDIADNSTSDPTSREAYRLLYDGVRDIITQFQKTDDPVYRAKLGKIAEEYGNKANQYSPDDLKQIDLYRRFESDVRKIYSETDSPYDVASKAMAPIMEARDPVGKALERSAKNQSLTLPMLLGSTAGGTAGGVKGAVAGAVLPMMLNASRAGTTMYRAGEPVSKAGRYAIPIFNEYDK